MADVNVAPVSVALSSSIVPGVAKSGTVAWPGGGGGGTGGSSTPLCAGRSMPRRAVVSRQRLRSAPPRPTRSLVQQCFACASAADKGDPTHSCTRTRISGKRSSGKFKHPPSRNPGYAPGAPPPPHPTNFSVNLRKRGDKFVSHRRFYFRGDEFAVGRFIFRATIVYQATKHFQGNKYNSEESGWRVDDCRQTIPVGEFIGQFTRGGVVGVVSAKRNAKHTSSFSRLAWPVQNCQLKATVLN